MASWAPILMGSLARARIALLGVGFLIGGLAVSGLLKGTPTAASDRGRHFDTTRGQIGFLLRAVENRRVGLWLMAAGAGILSYAIVKQKWH